MTIEFDAPDRKLAATRADTLLIGLFDDAASSGYAREADALGKGQLKALRARGDLSAKLGEVTLLPDPAGLKAQRLVVVGLGPQKEYGRRQFSKALSAALGAIAKTGVKRLAVALERPPAAQLSDYYLGRTVAELTGTALYRINAIRSGRKPAPSTLARVDVLASSAAQAELRRGLAHGAAISEGQSTLRDLGNLPGNVCTPRYLASRAQQLGREQRHIRVRVLDEAEMKRRKFGCLLAVARGSAEPPRLITLEYRGGRAGDAPVVLVGKGVTFDSGGISIKPGPAMDEMKWDMCGAGSVLATMQVIAQLKLKINVVGIMAAVENMPDGRAIKPGDIVTSADGQTVEILNTDAEGRLILADALIYARRYKPAALIDIATLTGACVIALGHHHTGVMSLNDALAREIVEAGVRADDRAWQLPLTEDYNDALKSNFADIANVGGRDGGAITAAAFLAKFTQGLNWAHLDIAGTAWRSTANKGGTGRPVGLLVDFLIARAGQR
ncbi:MAG: leucyl aminopeptidase [Nevskiaceae bacterium]|nr:leucyl aminopeptidase [Nevskiaceae bacterium]